MDTCPSEALVDVDSSFVVEAAVFESLHSGQAAVSNIEGLIKKALAEQVANVEEALRALRSLKESQAYKFGDSMVQQKLTNVIDLFKGLLSGIAPTQCHVASDDFGKYVWQQLPTYCNEVLKSGSGEKRVTGSEAYLVKLQRAEKLKEEGLLSFDHLTELHTFDFVADAAARGRVQALTDTLMSGMASGVRKRKSSSSKENAAKRAKPSLEDDFAEVDAIFE